MSTDGGPAIGQRATRQRTAVAAAVAELDDFRTAQEVHDALRQAGDKVGLTTVYRTLQALAEAGEIDMLVGADGQARYRHCGQGARHHHHLVCRQCGRTVEIEGPAVEEWADAVALQHGFTDVSHTLDVFGRCADCSTR